MVIKETIKDQTTMEILQFFSLLSVKGVHFLQYKDIITISCFYALWCYLFTGETAGFLYQDDIFSLFSWSNTKQTQEHA